MYSILKFIHACAWFVLHSISWRLYNHWFLLYFIFFILHSWQTNIYGHWRSSIRFVGLLKWILLWRDCLFYRINIICFIPDFKSMITLSLFMLYDFFCKARFQVWVWRWMHQIFSKKILIVYSKQGQVNSWSQEQDKENQDQIYDLLSFQRRRESAFWIHLPRKVPWYCSCRTKVSSLVTFWKARFMQSK